MPRWILGTLTHRKCGGVFLCQLDSPPVSSPFLSAFAAGLGLEPRSVAWPEHTRVKLFDGPTAESLEQETRQLMEEVGIAWSDLAGIGFGIGPGSFTGLRIGAAFANGARLAQDTLTLFALPVFPLAQLQAAWIQALEREHRPPLTEPTFSPLLEPPLDEWALPVNLPDVLAAVACLTLKHYEEVPWIEPCYGREPTPVLKLKDSHSRGNHV